MNKLDNGLFIFHRDLRLIDNIGLINASKKVKTLYLCFIFTPEQVSNKNDYRSDNSIQFMIESLNELSSETEKLDGRLIVLYNDNITAINNLIQELNIEGVYFNKDYSPYALDRDSKIIELCKKNNIECNSFEDYYLYEPGKIISSGSGEAYKKYTPFYNAVLNIEPLKPSKATVKNIGNKSIKGEVLLSSMITKLHITINDDKLVKGGRQNGLTKLLLAKKKQAEYDTKRDYFSEKTTHLSAYIKFGCVSIREVYYTFKKQFGLEHGLIRELIWREFFAHVLYAFPEVVGKSYQKKYRNLKWKNNKNDFKKWKNGNTGFPMIDACMRELNTTGYMHNRGRMTVASFLIKTLLIDWRWGEKYFAQQLTDYDVASNNGNWQGISGTGVDMKPYFRDMNPWIQSEKFDKNAIYIKYWVPELTDVPASDIHKWSEVHSKYTNVKYPEPMIDYYSRKEEMISMYKNA